MPFDQFFGITEDKTNQFIGFAGFTIDNGVDLIVNVFEDISGTPIEGAVVSAVWSGGTESNTYTTEEDGKAFFVIGDNTIVTLTITADCFDEQIISVSHGIGETSIQDVFLIVTVAEQGCFNPTPSNVTNFYRWHEMELAQLPLDKSVHSCFCDVAEGCQLEEGVVLPLLPNRWNRAPRQPFGVNFVTGFDVAFYINFTEGTTLDPSRRLVIIDGTKIVVDDLAELIDDPFGTGTNVYSQFKAPALSDGLYYMAIVNDSDQIILVSNPIEYITTDVSTTTGEIRYRNGLNMYGFNYETLTDFETIARIPLNALAAQYLDDEVIYKEVTTREHLSYKSQTDRRYTIETFFIDAGAHEAFAIAVKHDDFSINGVKLQKSGEYNITPNKGYPRTKGSVSMLDQAFAKLNQTVNK